MRAWILLVAFLSLVPLASADVGSCEAGACAGTQHSTVGSCDASADGTSASATDGAYVTTPLVYAFAQDYCYQGILFAPYGMRGVEAWAGVYFGPFPVPAAGVDWQRYDGSSGSGCSIETYVIGAGAAYLPCPAGDPPAGRPLALLP